jgi:hypothetical protein
MTRHAIYEQITKVYGLKMTLAMVGRWRRWFLDGRTNIFDEAVAVDQAMPPTKIRSTLSALYWILTHK